MTSLKYEGKGCPKRQLSTWTQFKEKDDMQRKWIKSNRCWDDVVYGWPQSTALQWRWLLKKNIQISRLFSHCTWRTVKKFGLWNFMKSIDHRFTHPIIRNQAVRTCLHNTEVDPSTCQPSKNQRWSKHQISCDKIHNDSSRGWHCQNQSNPMNQSY